MNPFLDRVTAQAINHQFGRDGAGNDADALANFKNAENAENFRRQAAECADRLILQSIERDRDAGIRNNGNTESDQNTPDERTDQIYQHSANGGDKHRHFLTPCDDANSDQKGHREQDIAQVCQIWIDLRKRQADRLTPDGYLQIRDASRTSAKGIT